MEMFSVVNAQAGLTALHEKSVLMLLMSHHKKATSLSSMD